MDISVAISTYEKIEIKKDVICQMKYSIPFSLTKQGEIFLAPYSNIERLLPLEFQQTNAVLFATCDNRTFHNLFLAIELSTKFDQVLIKKKQFFGNILGITVFFVQENAIQKFHFKSQQNFGKS
ncbi:hypothetical protein LOAG_05177 [Loa loa]|uniref:Uncharacterized protein n=1 Tax=Loa loa TaxID=7209 RepID=A0A1S0U1B4_LOALO|nr:hypothetical protein LOAG_05177 [Loa loa]EFO23307.1 hypothetical protein LOAG_05177 [Loa loa]